MTKLKQRKFVLHLHKHISRPTHYDLMLESLDSKSLETFRLNSKLRPLSTGETIKLEKIADHDIKFLSYQGKVNDSKGSVEIVQSGLFSQKKIDESNSILTFEFDGNTLEFSMKKALYNDGQPQETASTIDPTIFHLSLPI